MQSEGNSLCEWAAQLFISCILLVFLTKFVPVWNLMNRRRRTDYQMPVPVLWDVVMCLGSQ